MRFCYSFFFIVLLIASFSVAITQDDISRVLYEDYTIKENLNKRHEFLINEIKEDVILDEAIRIHFSNFKTANKLGNGNVNRDVANAIQNAILVSMKKIEQDSNGEIQSSKAIKTDFKGLAYQCTPSPGCISYFIKKAKNIPELQEITIRNHETKKTFDMKLNIAKGKGNQQAYLASKTQVNYPEFNSFKDDLDSFLVDKINEEMTSFNKKKLKRSLLKRTIAIYRRDGPDALIGTLQDYKPIIKLLDTLEINYVSVNNIDETLKNAITIKGNNQSRIKDTLFLIDDAVTGDDFYSVLKNKNGKPITMIGADARGLGVVNMITRFDEFQKIMDGHSNKILPKKFLATKLVIIIKDALYNADKIMDKSMNTYNKFLKDEMREKLPKVISEVNKQIKKEVKKLAHLKIEAKKLALSNIKDELLNKEAIRIYASAHKKYNELAQKSSDLMIMRATDTNLKILKQGNIQTIQSSVSGNFDLLKLYEEPDGIIILQTREEIENRVNRDRRVGLFNFRPTERKVERRKRQRRIERGTEIDEVRQCLINLIINLQITIP